MSMLGPCAPSLVMRALVSNPLPTMLKRCSGPLVVCSLPELDVAQAMASKSAETETSARWRIRKQAEDMVTSDVELPSAGDPSPAAAECPGGKVRGREPTGKEANGAGPARPSGEDRPSHRQHPVRLMRCLHPRSTPGCQT